MFIIIYLFIKITEDFDEDGDGDVCKYFPSTLPNTPQTKRLNEEEDTDNSINMNLFIITKYMNSGKLSSHNWFFNGFCKEISCEYAVLLDVGLTPEKFALYKMYKFMVND